MKILKPKIIIAVLVVFVLLAGSIAALVIYNEYQDNIIEENIKLRILYFRNPFGRSAYCFTLYSDNTFFVQYGECKDSLEKINTVGFVVSETDSGKCQLTTDEADSITKSAENVITIVSDNPSYYHVSHADFGDPKMISIFYTEHLHDPIIVREEVEELTNKLFELFPVELNRDYWYWD